MMFDIVDENDIIIGKASREDIHKNGLLHREVQVWLFNKEGELFFQKRGKHKDTYPGVLDVSVAGHVESGEAYEDAALRETKEETGLDIDKKKLVLLKIIRRNADDVSTGKKNNVIAYKYGYLFEGKVEDLKIKQDDGEGFEPVTIDSIATVPEIEKSRFIPFLFSKDSLDTFGKIKEIIGKK